MRRRTRVTSVVLAAALTAAACGDSGDDATTPPPSIASTTTTAEATTTSDAPSRTTSGARGPVPSAPTTAPTTIPSADGLLADPAASNLPPVAPATWFGSYRDGEDVHAVEVDSATGRIIRVLRTDTFGGCIEEGDDGECVVFAESAVAVSVAVDEDTVAYGFCCEPVSGFTLVYDRATGDEVATVIGSEPSYSPDGASLVTVTYADGGIYSIVGIGADPFGVELPIVSEFGDSAAWGDGRIALEIGRGVALYVPDGPTGADGLVSPTVAPVDPTRAWAGPTFQASGNLVVAEHPAATAGDSVGTVLDTSGGFVLAVDPLVVATFAYGGRVIQQAYDGSRVRLIYTLEDGSVRWQGGGQSGVLADPGSGFFAAAWW